MTTTTLATVTLNAPELAALSPSRAEQIRAVFEPMVTMLATFEDAYGAIEAEKEQGITPELSAKARKLRIGISKVRTTAESARKSAKEEYLRAGQAIDGTYRILAWAVTEKENALEAIEKHAERMEQERLEALQNERAALLAPYVEDAHERTLGTLEEDVWQALLTTKRKEHEDRIEAERVAEEERIRKVEEERIENERIRAENERLARENAEIEAAAKAEREKAEAALKEEQEKRSKLEAEAEAKRKQEEEAAKAREKAEADAARAPVKKRTKGWVEGFALPDLPGEDNEAAREIREKFAAFKVWALKRVNDL